MEQRLLGSCGLLIAIVFTSQPARAGDRQSREVHESKSEMFASSHKTAAISVSPRSEQIDISGVRPFEGSYSVFASKRLGGHDEKQSSAESKPEHKSLTLFHFDSKFGEVKLQPVLGKVTGAQFSLGF